MFSDILIVAWKELREIVFPEGRFQGGAKNVFILMGIAGLLFPLQSGVGWLTSWTSIYSACFPVMLVLNYTADAFAGERERHTLETVLASRLDDRAILLGKVVAIVLYGWVLVLACQPVAIIALNLAHQGNGFLFYRPAILISIVVISLVLALLICSVGMIVSLTAPTVRAAGQRMLVPFAVVILLPGGLGYVIHAMGWERAAAGITPGTLIAIVAGACLVVSAIALSIALKRFTRERLVLA